MVTVSNLSRGKQRAWYEAERKYLILRESGVREQGRGEQGVEGPK